ncbi:lysophospholipid acyltransferase family protein [Marinobacter sp. SS21]|uniref:lysophospholipid acyltransferase family protein n=1 Tax=Marinobacter sp. SS21 TaxID=2979460 RepID=UPI0023305E0F|nr:lysophospholipid acyltransferase family protein [Marinobacter sp. SS21]MDC0662589.1 lysophospholipid acyltransferase family protein [Marinobacter sp. SS21]
MGYIRLSVRLTLFVLFLGFTAGVAVAVSLAELIKRRPIDRTPYASFCFQGAVRCLGFRVRQQGQAIDGPVLFISNHISWSDIPVLGGTAPLRFLSKAEVGQWPLIGWLAHQAGTLFIQRRSGKSGLSRQEIAATLHQGQSVLVFPEGTTSAGLTVLPFHQRLLWAAADAGVAIQPISIGYLRDGQPDHLAPFIGDDDFQSHLMRLLQKPAVEVGVVYHPPVTVVPGALMDTRMDTDMDTLCQTLRQTVMEGLTQIHQSGAQSGTAGKPVSAR